MNSAMARPISAVFGSGIALIAILAGTAQAQYDGDPFDPFRAPFRSSSIPTGGRIGPQGRAYGVAPPGLGSVPGFGSTNDIGGPFEDFGAMRFATPDRLDSALFPNQGLYGDGSEPTGGAYIPNRDADERYRDAQQQKETLYYEAMSEPDPARKAELLREYREVSRQISLGLDSARASNGTDRAPGGPPPLGSSAASNAGSVSGGGIPRDVRSYDDLLLWSQLINRRAIDRSIGAGAAPE